MKRQKHPSCIAHQSYTGGLFRAVRVVDAVVCWLGCLGRMKHVWQLTCNMWSSAVVGCVYFWPSCGRCILFLVGNFTSCCWGEGSLWDLLYHGTEGVAPCAVVGCGGLSRESCVKISAPLARIGAWAVLATPKSFFCKHCWPGSR